MISEKKRVDTRARRKRAALREDHISFSDATNLYAKAGGKCVKKSTPRKICYVKCVQYMTTRAFSFELKNIALSYSILLKTFFFQFVLNSYTNNTKFFFVCLVFFLFFLNNLLSKKIARSTRVSPLFMVHYTKWYWHFILLMSDGKVFRGPWQFVWPSWKYEEYLISYRFECSVSAIIKIIYKIFVSEIIFGTNIL